MDDALTGGTCDVSRYQIIIIDVTVGPRNEDRSVGRYVSVELCANKSTKRIYFNKLYNKIVESETFNFF